MKILSIETSTEACSVALMLEDEIIDQFVVAPRKHSELILPMIDQLLANAELKIAQIDGIAFGCGPGAFTGVRLAAAVTQGIAFSVGCPVVPVSSLAALAQAAYSEFGHQRCLAMIDARMQEIYWAYFELDQNQIMRNEHEEQVCKPELLQLPKTATDWCGIGSGFDTYADTIAEISKNSRQAEMAWIKNRFPSAREVALIAKDQFISGKGYPAAQALPKYVRNQVAKKSQKNK